MYKVALLILGCIFGVQPTLAQEATRLSPPLKHEKRFYTDPTDTLYVARSLPLYLHLSPTIAIGANTHTLKSKRAAQYTNPIYLIEGLNLIGATKAVDPKTKKEVQGTSAYFEVYGDGTPPTSAGTFTKAPRHTHNDTLFFGKGLGFSLTSQDALSGVQDIYLSVNGAEFKPFQENKTDFAREGQYHLRYYAVDQVGNAEPPREAKFWVDTTEPVTAFSLNGTYEWNVLSSDVEITLTSTDNLSGVKTIFYRINQGDVRPYTGPIKVRSIPEGQHILSFYAEDQVNNAEPARTYEFFHDSTPPQIEVSIIGNQHQSDNTVYVSGNAQIKMDASDNISGVKAVQYTIDNNDQVTYTSPFFLPKKSGIHYIAYQLIDLVSNASEKITKKVYVDLSAPETSFDFSGSIFKDFETYVITREIALSLSAVDLEAGVKEIKYSINDGPFQTYNAPLLFPDLGSYEVTYYAEDYINNIEEPRSITVRVEEAKLNQANQTATIKKTDKAWYHNNDQLIGSTDLPFYLWISPSPDNTDQAFLLDIASSESDDTNKELFFPNEGQNQIRINTPAHQLVMNINIDGTAPITQAQFLDAQQSVQNDITYFGPGLNITLSAQDNEQGIRAGTKKIYFAIDGSEYVLYEAPLENFSREKPYTLTYYAIDNVGNLEPVSEKTFTVDTTPPKTRHTVEGSFYGQFLSPNAAIALDATDNLCGIETIFYAFDQNDLKPYTGKLTGQTLNALSDGQHELRYFARDFVGNTEEINRFTFQLDKSPPAIEFALAGQTHKRHDTLFVNARSRIQLKAADTSLEVQSILYQIDTNAQSSFSDPFALPQTQGMHTVSYFSTDLVGNTSPKQTQTLFLDLTPPTTESTITGTQYPEANTLFINGKTTIVLNATDLESGISAIQYKIGDTSFKTYDTPLVINRHGTHTITYRAIDQVNNTETNKSLSVFVDNIPPQINLSYNVDPTMDTERNLPVIQRRALIYIEAEETDTAIDKITYSINGGKEQLYRNPLSNFKRNEVLTLKIKAIDRLENLAEKEVSFWVE